MAHWSKYHHDSRSDLGYGRTSPRFHLSRSRGSHYPYLDPDIPEEDLPEDEVDEESLEAVARMTTTFSDMDPFAVRKSNPFYYGAGNLKLSDCFWKIDKVLSEIESMGTSMSPIPGLHRGRNVMMGAMAPGGAHAQYLTPSSFSRTGTTYGWSHAPPPIDDDLDDSESEEDLTSLQDLISLMLSQGGKE